MPLIDTGIVPTHGPRPRAWSDESVAVDVADEPTDRVAVAVGQRPKPAWQLTQYSSVEPQYPYCEQHCCPGHRVFAPGPHAPSLDTGMSAEVVADLVAERVTVRVAVRVMVEPNQVGRGSAVGGAHAVRRWGVEASTSMSKCAYLNLT